MIHSIKGLSLRFFQTNKFIVLSSIVTVMLSISLIIIMSLFIVNAKQSLKSEIHKLYGIMDIAVGYNLDDNKQIDTAFIGNISKLKNVQAYSSVLVTRLNVNKIRSEVYTLGIENDSLGKSRYQVSKNIAENEVSINKRLAQELKAKTGDQVSIENRTLRVREVIDDIEGAGIVTDKLILSRKIVKQIILEKTGVNNEATYIQIKAKVDANKIFLANQIKELDPSLRIDVVEEDPIIKKNLEYLNGFIIVLSILVLIVTSLVVITNFEVVLYKYKNQFAIMRSIGASRNQIFKLVWMQTGLINATGALLGFILALGCYQLLHEGLEQLFSFQSESIQLHYSIAILIMIVSLALIQAFMLVPAYKSTKILPIKILQSNEENDFSGKKFRKILGTSILIACLSLIVFGIANRVPLYILVAALLLVLGVFQLLPLLLPTILARISPLIGIVFGKQAYIAIRNMIPQVRRNTFVILTISTMMIIAVFGSAFFNTIKTNEENYLKEQYPTNIVLKSRLGSQSNLPLTELQNEIKEVNGVTSSYATTGVATAGVEVNGKFKDFEYQLVDMKEMSRAGFLPELSNVTGKEMIVTQEFAEKYHIEKGETLNLGLYSDEAQKMIPNGTYTVSGIVKDFPATFTDVIFDRSNKAFTTKFIHFDSFYISSKNEKSTLKEIATLKRQYPEIQVNSYKTSLKESKLMLYQRWHIFIAVINILLVSVCIAVINTLINNVYSKRKELAILRTLSLNRNGITKVIMTQIFVYILLGLGLGMILGMLMTYILSLIDGTSIHFDYLYSAIIICVFIAVMSLIFIPFARSIGKTKLFLELAHDNK
ncbi:FtsX-like permease family protein [Neobacillus sp. PS3-40]|uniref:FtsX-like permease family protein n=1 Tax=Neobacillus sp. PS3-40 TaxID=3070679 RepID=UPI0027E1A215|nr:FtsX-like permease family protein [Neobacillus sp. PS3-40]WML43911.1 FtsX-like permease family protein [Neobacillus sp. PS3-40]